MIWIWFYFMLIFFFWLFLVNFVFLFSPIFPKIKIKIVSLAWVFTSKFFMLILTNKFHCFSYSTIMHMHFSHMNMFLGWEIKTTLKILKIKCRDSNPCDFLSHSFFRGLFSFDLSLFFSFFFFYLKVHNFFVA